MSLTVSSINKYPRQVVSETRKETPLSTRETESEIWKKKIQDRQEIKERKNTRKSRLIKLRHV